MKIADYRTANILKKPNKHRNGQCRRGDGSGKCIARLLVFDD